MIYCPICGTANRDGSKYCNECGIKFDPQMQKCSNCGTLNPVEDRACKACGQSLPSQLSLGLRKEPTSAQEGSAPAPPEDVTEVPGWLKGMPILPSHDARRAAEGGEQVEEPKESTERYDLLAGPVPPAGDGITPEVQPSPSRRFVEEEALYHLLADTQGTLQPEPLIAQTRVALTSTPLDGGPSPQVDDETASKARLFAEIVSPPGEVTLAATARRKPEWLNRLPHWIIYALLIAAVILPLLLWDSLPSVVRESRLGSAFFLQGRTIDVTLPVADLYNQIETLDSGARVLVAFDYDPSTVEEMDLVAGAIVGHLMDQQARVVAVSLLPAGAATAQELLERTAAGQPGYADGYGRRYANLGYLPGQMVAVRLLGQSVPKALPLDFLGNPVLDLEVMEGVVSLQDFDLIVELAAVQDSVRWWIEQGGTPHGIPLGAGVSASIEPLVRPYYETEPRQLVGVVGGVPGVAMYQALGAVEGSTLQSNDSQGAGSQDPGPGQQARQQATLQGQPERSTAPRLDSQLTGFAVFLLVVLVGNGVYFVRRVAGKER